MSYTPEQLRGAIASALEGFWEMGVRDLSEPNPTPRKIERIIEQSGNAWELGEDGRYTAEKEAEWCGYAVAAAGRSVGDYLSRGRCLDVAVSRPVAVHCLGSTARLASTARWAKANAPEPETIAPNHTQRGDIVVIDTGGGQAHGDHITVARGGVRRGKVPTVEGNGHGEFPDGTRGEGVVVNDRDLETVHAVYRLTPEHFEGADL